MDVRMAINNQNTRYKQNTQVYLPLLPLSLTDLSVWSELVTSLVVFTKAVVFVEAQMNAAFCTFVHSVDLTITQWHRKMKSPRSRRASIQCVHIGISLNVANKLKLYPHIFIFSPDLGVRPLSLSPQSKTTPITVHRRCHTPKSTCSLYVGWCCIHFKFEW